VAVSDAKARGEAAPALAQQVMLRYAAFLGGSDHDAAMRVLTPTGAAPKADSAATIIGPIMAGMLVLFVFFMGGNGAQSIIKEHEEGTLGRLFTTPTSQLGIVGGKFLAVFFTLVVQTLVLLGASALLFRIAWGQPLAVMLSAFCLIICATGFGIMLMSFVKDTRQTGPVLGGVITITGMLGGLMTNGIANIPPIMDTVSLSMPQGWALRAIKLCLAGGSVGDVLLPAVVMTILGAAFFLVGLALFRRRFA
jgi:ABC-2 type transport system permease protein